MESFKSPNMFYLIEFAPLFLQGVQSVMCYVYSTSISTQQSSEVCQADSAQLVQVHPVSFIPEPEISANWSQQHPGD